MEWRCMRVSGLDKRLERLEQRLAPREDHAVYPRPHMVAALDEIASAKGSGREPAQWALEAVEPLREE